MVLGSGLNPSPSPVQHQKQISTTFTRQNWDLSAIGHLAFTVRDETSWEGIFVPQTRYSLKRLSFLNLINWYSLFG